ncbi:MAG: tail fiber protein [Candidatus Sedimenticola sp. (ex Thyasira tokunagai)]
MEYETGISGGGQPVSTTQPSLALNPLIRINSSNYYNLGEVTFFGGNFAPSGWAEANGQLLPINQNESLFSLLGTTYGGDGRTTFALPDLRGRTAIGDGTGSGLTTRHLGDRVGDNNVTVTTSNLASHDHLLHPGNSTNPTGGNAPYNNMQASLGLNYVVAMNGIYPYSGGSGNFSDEPTMGFIDLFASHDYGTPNNYASADGQLLTIAQNTALFSLFGTTYGGDGRTTFALPDLRGRSAIGVGSGPGLTPQALGQIGGVESVTMTEANLPTHSHTLGSGANSTEPTGDGQSLTNMQPTIGLRYLVATQGVFPGGDPDMPMLGEIGLFGGNFVPGGWAAAEGQLLSISQNSALFSLFGTMYGGDGRTTFALPDLSGLLLIGDGAGPGLDTWMLGEEGGLESQILSIENMPAHLHTYVPIPAAAWLFGSGLLGLIGLRRLKKQA